MRLTVSIVVLILLLFSVNIFISVTQIRKSLLNGACELATESLSLNISKVNQFISEKKQIVASLGFTTQFRDFAKNVPSRFYFRGARTQSPSEIEHDYNKLPDDIKRLADSISIAEPDSKRDPELVKKYNELMNTCVRIDNSDPDIFLTYLVVEKTQEYFCDPDTTEPMYTHYYVRNRDWYKDGIKGDYPIITTPYKDISLGVLVVTCTSPMKENGQLLGAVNIDFKINTISSLVEKLKLTEDSFAF
ncbi:MAG: cache domain-containing protein, partial [Spirochaetales bacterium]|nr:cache domain-containing protein [Spirochaetales bacterium]